MANVELHVFIADWCGHCRQFAPERELLESKCKQMGLPIFVHNESDSDYEQYAREARIRGFPTIMAKINGTYVEHEGSRTALDILEFVQQNVVSRGGNIQSNNATANSNNSFFNKYKKYKLKYLKLKTQMANQHFLS